MISRRIGQQTLAFAHPPVIRGRAAVVGPKEGEGPLASYFDMIKEDKLLGEKSWERAESRLMIEAIETAVKKAYLTADDLDFMLAGDLLNQITASNFTAREISRPLIGLYSACSTFAEGLAIGAALVDAGYARHLVVATSSHHQTAERQYRYPTEFGNQRSLSAQWTVTGAGAVVLSGEGVGPVITYATIGKVVDMGSKDTSNMGEAMAPVAADTIWQHFQDTSRSPQDYDLIVTGDLGRIGNPLTAELLSKAGLELGGRFSDCGIMIYHQTQDVHAGGSGAACSAVVFGGYLLSQLESRQIKRILLVATGSLHSPTSYQQGESIPGIAHAVSVEYLQ